MKHFKKFYMIVVLFVQMSTFRDKTQKPRSRVLIVLDGNKYVIAIGLFTLKLEILEFNNVQKNIFIFYIIVFFDVDSEYEVRFLRSH